MLIIADVWVINVTYLIVFCVCAKTKVSLTDILYSLLPINFGYYWYVTCYLLFYLLYPYLNKFIETLSKAQFFRFTFILVLLYLILNTFLVNSTKYFTSNLVVWISIYFLVYYLKKYHYVFFEDIKLNWIIFISLVIFLVVMTYVFNVLAFKIGYFEDKIYMLSGNQSPILILIALSLFNLFRHLEFSSKFINFISSLTLYIYVIHDEYLFWQIRRQISDYVSSTIIKGSLFPEPIIYVLGLFVCAVFIATIYKITIHKLILPIVDKLYVYVKKLWENFETKCISK